MKIFNPFKKSKKSEKKKAVAVKAAKEEKKPVKARKSKYTEAYKVLIKPLTSEKIIDLETDYNQYVFEVAKKANKIEIKKAIEAVYGIKPITVNIVNIKGKQVRSGRVQGKTKGWKKAVVGLRKGERIEVFKKG